MDKLTVYYQNVRGLNDRKKCETFFENVKKKDYDVICLTETFLQDPFTETLFDDRYYVFRGDRRTKERRGGVLIAVKKALNPKNEEGWRHQGFIVEDAWVTITKSEETIHLYCVYIPDNRSSASKASYQRELSRLMRRENIHSAYIIITGDFNEPDILWINEGNPSRLKAKKKKNELKSKQKWKRPTLLSDFIEHNKFRQSYGIISHKNILDLVLSNTDLITSHPEPLVKEEKHHQAILIKFKPRSRSYPEKNIQEHFSKHSTTNPEVAGSSSNVGT